MKVYLAGPMQGYPEFNFPTFHKAAKYLRSLGHEVFSPAEKDMERHGADFGKGNAKGDIKAAEAKGFSLRHALGEDTDYICYQAEALAMLPGWERSNGARAEHTLATALGHQFMYLRREEYEDL